MNTKKNRGASLAVRKYIKRVFTPGDWLPPETELAETLGVKRYAVTKALNDLRSQGIVRREAGRGTQMLESTPTNPTENPTIAFIASELTSVLSLGLVSALQKELAQRNFRLALRSTEHEGKLELMRLAELAKGNFTGAIIIPDDPDSGDEIAALYDSGFPIVIVDRPIEKFNLPSVTTDHFQGAASIVSHLISLGHKRIGHVTYSGEWHESYGVKQRHRGYLHALKEAGIQEDPNLISYVDIPAGNYAPNTEKPDISAYISTHQLLASADPPTAIFAVNDYLCESIMAASLNHNLRIPEDISIAGFDHDIYSNPDGAVLTTYAHPVNSMAKIISSKLEEQIGGFGTSSELVAVPGRLIKGNSTGQVRDGIREKDQLV